MKVAVIGFKKDVLERQLNDHGFKNNNVNPDIVIGFGGEGTFLFSEQRYPSTPKLFIKHNSECKNCSAHNFSNILNKLKNKNYKIKQLMKLEASIKNNTIRGINDINIHYTPPCALRFNISINKNHINNIIGDGILISTPYGSSAYYKSITRKTFNKGFGIAFNNPVKKLKNIIINDNNLIKVKIIRGPGTLSADCNKDVIQLKENDIITIKKSRPANIILTNNNIKNII